MNNNPLDTFKANISTRYWPRVQRFIGDDLKQVFLEYINDNESLMTALLSLHEALPFPLRLAVRRETFISFCMEQRQAMNDFLLESPKETEEQAEVPALPTPEPVAEIPTTES